MAKIIEVTVSPKGETKLETKGFSGSNCQDASREFEKALGVAGEFVPTPEFFNPPESTSVDVQQ